MSTKVKGLLKGLRYISQIFDEKEEDIQIGFPTDVKHVAHIGSDDPSANAPSWMNEYKSEPSQGTENAIEKLEAVAEHNNNNSSSKGSKIRHLIPKSRHQSIDNNDSTKHKHTRRHRSSDPSSESSSVHDSSSGGSRHSRRHHRGSNHGSESSSQDGMPPTATKPRRKSKTASSEDGGSVQKPSSTRTSKRSSKGDSLTDISFTELGSGGPEHENEKNV